MTKTIQLTIGGVPEHFNLPWHLALEAGLFEKEKVSVRWTDYPGGTGAMTKDLRSGILDVAVLLTEGIVADISNGNPSKIIAPYVSSPLIWGIHVPAQSSFQNVNQLQGKRYAISRMGSGSHLMAFVDARNRGWHPNEQELVIVGDLNGAREAFRKGEADAFMWERFMTQPLVDNGEFRRIGECLTPWPCFVIAARNEIIESHLSALKKVLSVVNRAVKSFMKDPNAPQSVAQRYSLKLDDAATWFAHTRWAVGEELAPDVLPNVVQTLYELKVIDKLMLPSALYHKIE